MLLTACEEQNPTGYQIAETLKLAGFAANQECKAEHFYEFDNLSPNNDYFFAYVIHLEPFPDSLLGTNPGGLSGWESGSDTNELHLKVLRQAQASAGAFSKVTWLPLLEEFTGAGYYRRFVIIDTEGTDDPHCAEFYAYNRQTHSLYYIGYKY